MTTQSAFEFKGASYVSFQLEGLRLTERRQAGIVLRHADGGFSILHTSDPPHFRRNVAALFVDSAGFGAGINFIHPATVLPTLVQRLTASQLLVGLVMTAWSGMWFLPQLGAGGWLSDKPRKKPYLVGWAAAGRPALAALALMLALATHLPAWALVLALLAAIIIFRGTDAVAAVAWFDVMSGAVPPSRRGRVLGKAQMFSALLGLGAATFVRWALGPQGPAFPYNYAMLFGLATVGMGVSWAALTALVELPGQVDDSRWNVLAHARNVLIHDRRFRHVTVARLLSGLAGLAWPFYVLHATRVLHLPDSVIGLFIAIQATTGAIASAVLGWVSERYGSVRVIWISSVAACVPPLLAMLLHLILPAPAVCAIVYLILYSFLSIVDYSFLLGYLNYVLEIAPPAQRPAYMGLTNTLGGLLVILPTLGGWLLANTSYPVLFGVTLLGVLGGLVVAAGLPLRYEPT